MSHSLIELKTMVTGQEINEFTELHNVLSSPANNYNIWTLSSANQINIGQILSNISPITKNTPWFESYWDTIKIAASGYWKINKPVDSLNITPEEQIVLDNIVESFLSTIHFQKRASVKTLYDNSVVDSTSTVHPFEDFSAYKSNVTHAYVNDDFYEQIASYYISMAQRYINENIQHYEYTGQLKDRNTDELLKNYLVSFQDQNDPNYTRFFGKEFTNHEGYFRLKFNTLVELTSPPTYGLVLKIEHKDLTTLFESIDYDPSNDNVSGIETSITVPTPDPISATMSEVSHEDVLGPIPPEVLTHIASVETDQNITIERLEDIRSVGGLKNYDTTALSPIELFYVNNIDALANLEIVSTDLRFNKDLIEAGYTSITHIANEAQDTFVTKNKNLTGDKSFAIAKLHFQAKAAHRFAMNHVANSYATKPGTTPEDHDAPCGCQDCESAVSPMAYLADLLNFAFKNIVDETDGEVIDFAFLDENLFQPFEDLPVTCQELENEMCQNRISVEVLRKYYASPELASGITPEITSELQNDVDVYTNNVYRLLLNSLGTSYEEIRKARSISDTEERKKITDRMGVALFSPDPEDSAIIIDTLEKLFVDLSGDDAITESQLEGLFGLRDSTTEDVLSPTPPSFIEFRKADYLRETWKTQDHTTIEFNDNTKVIIDPDVVTIDDFRFPEASNPSFALWKKRRDWLDGIFLGLSNDTVGIGRNQMLASDNVIVTHQILTDLYEENDPIIYNDGSDQTFTLSYQYQLNDSTYFRVKENITSDHTGGVITVNTDVISSPQVAIKSCDVMITNFSGEVYDSTNFPTLWENDPAVFISKLKEDISKAQNGDETGYINLETISLKLPAAKRFVEIYDQFDSNVIKPAGNLSEEEWTEFQNIMVNVLKTKVNQLWLDEEEVGNITLNPKDFWLPEYSPKEGVWPISNEHVPFIDPWLISNSELLEITARTESEITDFTTTYIERKDQISQFKNDLFGDQDPASLFEETYGLPFMFSWDTNAVHGSFQKLLNDLTDPVHSTEAAHNITNMLKMEVQDFQFVMGVLSSDLAQVSDYDWNRVYGILTQANKVLAMYPQWISDETLPDLTTPAPLWSARKAKLPKHLASAEQRKLWEKALEQNSEAPIIDADLIGPADLANVVAGDPAFDLWKARFLEMNEDIMGGTIHDIAEFAGNLNSTAEFNALTSEFLNHKETSLSVIKVQEEDGKDISARVSQLNLTKGAFNYLMSMYDIVGSMTDEEKDNVVRILANVQKLRSSLEYQMEEKDEANGIVLSPDFFQIPAQPLGEFPAQEPYELVEWLATSKDKNKWQRKLRGRIDQEQSMITAYQQLLLDVDDAMIIQLRDALADACIEAGAYADAKELGDKLLIDLENNCCFKTNRVAQAIETLQQLIWKQRTGLLEGEYPHLNSIADDFDAAWTWMGNYANWRAAMFVFLYPENVLIPSLRKNQSEGFQQVIKSTRNNRRFNPKQACEVVNEMTDYLKDISNLKVISTVRTKVPNTFDCDGETSGSKNVLFSFAESNVSGKSYYGISDVDDEDNPKIGNWQEIPFIPEGAILKGSDQYNPSANNNVNHIYLFYLKNDLDSENKFFVQRYDLNNLDWVNEELTFEVNKDELGINTEEGYISGLENLDTDITPGLPAGLTKISHTIKELKIMENNHTWLQPHIAITLIAKYNGYRPYGQYQEDRYLTFTRYLDSNGVELKINGLWKSSINDENQTYGLATSFISEDISHPDISDIRSYLLLDRKNQHDSVFAETFRVIYLNWDNPIETAVYSGSTTEYYLDGYNRWAGAFRIPGTSKVRFRINYGNSSKHEFDLEFGVDTPLDNILGFMDDNLVSNYCGNNASLNYQWSVLNNNDSENPYLHKVYESDDLLELDIPYNLTPDFSDFTIFNQLKSDESLNLKQELSLTDFLYNSDKISRSYAEEAYFFTPLQVALQLSSTGHYLEALDWFRNIYDYTKPVGQRKIYFGLKYEEEIENLVEQAEQWYDDPLNPHAIAHNRAHAYTRYTIIQIAQCMMAYADAEFTKDTAETVPRARELYEEALELLNLLKPDNPCPTENAIENFLSLLEESIYIIQWKDVFEVMYELKDADVITKPGGLIDVITNKISTIDSDNEASVLDEVKVVIANELIDPMPYTLKSKFESYQDEINEKLERVMMNSAFTSSIEKSSYDGGKSFTNTLNKMTGLEEAELEAANLNWLGDASISMADEETKSVDPLAKGPEGELQSYFNEHPRNGFLINSPFPDIHLSGMGLNFCVVPNPLIKAYCMRAFVNLFKIRNCMNIAGIVRELAPFSAPTDSTSGVPSIGVGGSISLPSNNTIPPSNYRYKYLIDRTKQLVGMAQQVESAFLNALEKFDAESYSILRAEQDIDSSKANIKLQDLKVKEAKDGVTLSELQRERSTIQVNGLQAMIDEGLLSSELELMNLYQNLAILQTIAALAGRVEDISRFAISYGANDLPGKLANAPGLAAGIFSAFIRTTAEISSIGINNQISNASLFASLERRQQEWEFQKSVANQDVRIGDQQIKLSKDRVRIAGQERVMSVLQNDHAKATLDFLKNKFTSAELYEWMSKILEDIYAFFLQEATAMALVAQRQLSFERQVDLPPFIKSDYWIIDEGSFGDVSITGESQTDRRGITGSSRLLKDIYELDQYAFNTNSPKMQMSKTISLNEIAPIQMQELRENGVMGFFTTQDMFDQDYPGHYLRLIKRVNVSVIALNSPVKGIKATLTNGGISRVITGGDVFQEKTIYRQPEQIALSGGVGDYGVFQLQADGEFLKPFEGHGVDTNWEFRMEKAANAFDFNSIADVLVTVEYEALNSFTYRAAVESRLNLEQNQSNNLAISFKNNLPDQWFDLNNPEPGVNDTVTFSINENDLAPNVSLTNVEHIAMYFAMKDDLEFNGSVSVSNPNGNGSAEPLANLITTRANGGGFINLQGAAVNGEWTLQMDTNDANYVSENVDDVILVITYGGQPETYGNLN